MVILSYTVVHTNVRYYAVWYMWYYAKWCNALAMHVMYTCADTRAAEVVPACIIQQSPTLPVCTPSTVSSTMFAFCRNIILYILRSHIFCNHTSFIACRAGILYSVHKIPWDLSLVHFGSRASLTPFPCTSYLYAPLLLLLICAPPLTQRW